MKAASYLFVAVALAAAVTSAVSIRNTVDFLNEAETATGTVTGHHVQRDSDSNDIIYYPKIRFSAPSGQQIEFVSDSGRSFKSQEIGEQVEVLYRPQDPRDARRAGFMNTWILPITATAFALAFGSAALIVFRMERSGARLQAGPPSIGADPGTVAQWNIALKSGHEKLYQGVAYMFAVMGAILLVVTVVILLTSDDLALWMAIPAAVAVGSLLAGRKTVTDVRRNTTTRAKRALRDTGQPVPAKVVRVTEVQALSVAESHPHRIVAEGVDPRSGRSRTFESDYVWSAPSPELVNQPVTVWVGSEGKDKYWVDLETLGKL